MNTPTADWLGLRSQVTELARDCACDDPALVKARDELAANPIAAAIRKQHEDNAAPPLSPAAMDQLARILLGDRAGRGEGSRHGC